MIRLVKIGKKKQKGFTLTELLIAMVVLGILTMIAYPSYQNSLRKSRRSDAMTALTNDQIILERCYAQNFSYNAACASLPAYPHNSQQGLYSVNLSNLTASTYTLTATPLGDQANDTTCASMSINQAGTKVGLDSTSTAQNSCWNP